MPLNKNLVKTQFIHFLMAIILLLPTFSLAEPIARTQSAESLYQLVLEHLKQKTDQKLYNTAINIKKISSKLNLPLCNGPIDLDDNAPTKYFGRLSIKLQCANPFWKLYLSAEIQGDLPVVKTTQGILKQAVIKEDDVVQELLPYQQVRNDAFINTETVIGLRAKKSIGPNTILTVKMVQPPFLVFKGRIVRIITRIGSIKVESVGTALSDGVLDQQITVKNNASNKTLRAIVIGPNQVEVP